MLTKLSKLKPLKLYKDRTFVFESEPTKTHDNIVHILTDKPKVVESLIAKPLFRKEYLKAAFVPRLIKPMGMKTIRIDQKSYYEKIKEISGGNIYLTKLRPEMYQGRNLYYDSSIKLEKMIKLNRMKGAKRVQFIENQIREIVVETTKEIGYSNSYLIIPMNGNSNLSMEVKSSPNITDPVSVFLQLLWKDKLNLSEYKDTKIIFIDPNSRIFTAIDFTNISIEELKKHKQRFFSIIYRINNIALKKESADDLLDDELGRPHTDEEMNEHDNVLNKALNKLGIEFIYDGSFNTINTKDAKLLQQASDIVNKYVNEGMKGKDLLNAILEDDKFGQLKVVAKENKKIARQKENIFRTSVAKEYDHLDQMESELEDTTKLVPTELPLYEGSIDDRVKLSSLLALDTEYLAKKKDQDIMNILSHFGMNSDYPLVLETYEIEDTSDEWSKKDTIRAKYRTEDGKILNFVIDIPRFIDGRYFYAGGGKKVMNKQITRLPIVKTKTDRVEIATNYNKVTIERLGQKVSRKNEYLMKILKKKNAEFGDLIIEFGDNGSINADFLNNFEYEELSGKLTKLENDNYVINLNRAVMTTYIELLDQEIQDHMTDKMTPFGYSKKKNKILVVDDANKGGIYLVDKEGIDKSEHEDLFTFITREMLGMTDDDKLPNIGKAFMYTRMKMLKRNFSVLSTVAHKYGLTSTLKMYKVPYEFVPKRRRANADWVEVKFKDGFLYYRDDIRYNLLLNALHILNPSDYDFKQFDTKEPYIDYFDYLGHPSYISNTLLNNMDLMVDPISAEVLRDMGLPTDIYRLLLHANTLLTDNACRQLNDMRNYRIRGNEMVFATLYNVMADAVVKYKQAKYNNSGKASISVNRNALLSKLMALPNVNEHSTLNPILEIDALTNASGKGLRGINMDRAYSQEMRSYHVQTQFGLFGNATPYSGKAGMTKSLTLNPTIDTVRGYIKEADPGALDPTNMFTPVELLSSGFSPTHSDPVRSAMQAGQAKHTLATEDSDPILVGSGVNKTLAHMLSDDFAFKAKNAGKVDKIDEVNKLVLLTYTDGTRDAIDISGDIVKNSGGGFYLKNLFKVVYKEGEKFRKGDVLAFNPAYFKGKGSNVDYQAGMLAKVGIASADFVFEDACAVSETLGVRGASRVTMKKQVSLGANATIHKIKKIGDPVNTGEALMEFTASFEDADTNTFLDSLFQDMDDSERDKYNKETIDSKYSGKVVDIKVFYNVPKKDLSKSIKKLIKEYDDSIDKRRAALEGIETDSVILPIKGEKNIDKVNGKFFEGVLVEFYIEYYDELNKGDKIIFSTALKGIISKRFTKDESPYSEHRGEDEHIEAIVSPISVFARMVPDVYLQLYSNKALIELKRTVDKIWNGNDNKTLSYNDKLVTNANRD